MSFEGKVVAITGGGVGMGREAAILYAKQGAKVVVNSLSDSGAETVRLCKEQVARQPSYRERCGEALSKKIIDTAIDKDGKLDILVPAAVWFVREV